MFVGDRMSRPVITVSPEDPVNDVLAMFNREHIRRAPVVGWGRIPNRLIECITHQSNHAQCLGDQLSGQ